MDWLGMELDSVYLGNSIEILKDFPEHSINLCFTSPSPFLYDVEKGIGSEKTLRSYIENLIFLFRQVGRVLKPNGSLWVNLSDSHGEDGKLDCVPDHFLFNMVREGWLIRSKCSWVRTEKHDYQEDYNRFLRDWEYLFFFTKSKDHYFNNPKNKVLSSVFQFPSLTPKGNNFESGFPEKLIEKVIHLTCPENGVVLDPLGGAGTTGVVVKRMNRKFVLIDIDELKINAMKARLGIQY